MFMTGKCSNCKSRKEYNDSYCSFCMDHNYCSYTYDDKMPMYTYNTAKHLIFDCTMELEHNHNGLTNLEIANKLLAIIKELDKMNL